MPHCSWIALRAAATLRPPDAEGVDADQGHAGFAVVEHRRPHFASVVKRLVKLFSVIAGLFHADARA